MKMARVNHDVIKLAGGLDLSTPIIELEAGVMRDGVNYECAVSGGYTRIPGYERYDGRPAPSLAAYMILYAATFTTTPVPGDILTGSVSGNSGTVFYVDAAINRIIVTKTTGSFAANDVFSVVGGTVGLRSFPVVPVTSESASIYTGLAANVYRSDIQTVGGTDCAGTALGATLYNNVVYAFRRNAANTNTLLYKSSVTGWVLVPYYHEVYFTSTTGAAPAEGTNLTQTGGKTAVIKRVVLQSGAWGTNAAGKFIITTPNITFASGAATASGTSVILTGENALINFSVSGSKFEFKKGNFYGGAATNRVYGVDGANRMFEFDGDILSPIDIFPVAQRSSDIPKHLAIHKNILFASIGASLFYGDGGEPHSFLAGLFAGEIGAGQDITGINSLPGASNTAALLVTSRDNTYILYGTGVVTANVADFNFVTYNAGAGAIDNTIQNMSEAYMMDDRGVISLKASQNFGNFDQSTLTQHINKFISQNKTNVSCSSLNRSKSQYRLFFNSGYALYISIVNGKIIGVTKIAFPVSAYMADESKFSNGEEASFFCGTDGYVHRMDKGTSFDGQPITAYMTLKHHSIGSPRTRKRYRKAAVEISSAGYCSINFGYNLGYGTPEISQSNYKQYVSDINTPVWDGFTWDAFTWDGQSIIPNECEMLGTAENVAITIRSSSAYFPEHTINSIILHYSNRRDMR